jgi:tryptophan-rich sensory protein
MKALGIIWVVLAASIAIVAASMYVLAGMTPTLERLMMVEMFLFYLGFVGAAAIGMSR